MYLKANKQFYEELRKEVNSNTDPTAGHTEQEASLIDYPSNMYLKADKQFYENLRKEVNSNTDPTAGHTEHEAQLQERPSKQTEKQIMTTVKPEEVINEDKESFLWPLYGSTCTEEEKKEFETTVNSRCASTDKCMTSDVKEFLKRERNKGTIIRPKQITQEFEIVKKFGYPYTYKAYSKY